MTTTSFQALEVPIEQLVPSPINVRRELGVISELADSIREQGVLEPLVVRPAPDGKYEVTRPSHGGSWSRTARWWDRGTRVFSDSASVRLDTTDGHTLLLTSRRTGNTNREQMYHIGIWPEEYRVVVAKGVVSPRPAYQPIAAEIILVNTPGVTTADLSFFDYKRRRRPLYPFEPDVTYP